MLIKILTPDFVFENTAGRLVQLVHDGWKQVNVITSVAGQKRGGHFHKFNEEAFYIVSGDFELTVSRDGIEEVYPFSAGDMFTIPAFVKHTFFYKTDTLLVSMYDRGVEMTPEVKDIWTE